MMAVEYPSSCHMSALVKNRLLSVADSPTSSTMNGAGREKNLIRRDMDCFITMSIYYLGSFRATSLASSTMLSSSGFRSKSPNLLVAAVLISQSAMLGFFGSNDPCR